MNQSEAQIGAVTKSECFPTVVWTKTSPKPQRYSVYNHIKTKKATNPHFLEAVISKCFYFSVDPT